MWLITGSVALKHWCSDFNRKPVDVDFLSPINVVSSKPSVFGIESHWYPIAEEIVKRNRDSTFVDLDMLYTIKVSHAAWDVKWKKTMFDINYMQQRGAKIVHEDIFESLLKHWSTVHGAKRVNLKMQNEQFFADAVCRKHDHDALHRLVANGNDPMHVLIRPDMESPWCDFQLWDRLSYEAKIKTAAEEICVIAIERYLTDIKTSSILLACSQAYRNLILTMTTGWFNRFLIENEREIYVQSRDWYLSTCRRIVND